MEQAPGPIHSEPKSGLHLNEHLLCGLMGLLQQTLSSVNEPL